MAIRWWLSGVCAAALAAGCGGRVFVDGEAGGGGSDGGGGSGGDVVTMATTTSTSTTTGGDPGEVTPACLAYCEAIQDKSCAAAGDCHARCMSLYKPGCAAEVEAVLACLPEWLKDSCQITYPDLWDEGCYQAMDDMEYCGDDPFVSCSFGGAELVGDSGCVGYTDCPEGSLEFSCTDNGQCACLQDGVTIGGCAMPFTGTEACLPRITCCSSFFDL